MTVNGTHHRPMVGESGYERKELDGYWTPEWCTHALLDAVTFPTWVWECASGTGNICRVLSKRGYIVVATDIADHGHYDRLEDFLKAKIPPGRTKAIITNPPYSHAEEFVRHALLMMGERRGQVAMLLRNEFDSAATRVDLFDRPPFRSKLVLTKRPKWDETDKNGPRHNFAWFIWDWEFTGEPTLLYQRRSA